MTKQKADTITLKGITFGRDLIPILKRKIVVGKDGIPILYSRKVKK